MNATTRSNPHSAAPSVKIIINPVGMDRPKAWLAAGIEDFRRATAVSLAYGMFWVGISIAVTVGALMLDLWHWLLPLIAGFMFIGPLVAVGSYGISRALEANRAPHLGDAFSAWKPHAGQLAMMGVMMMIFSWPGFASPRCSSPCSTASRRPAPRRSMPRC